MAKFHVKAKSGIVFFSKDKNGKVVRNRAEFGSVINLNEKQCALYAAKGEKLPVSATKETENK
jgi:hypothetical protein